MLITVEQEVCKTFFSYSFFINVSYYNDQHYKRTLLNLGVRYVCVVDINVYVVSMLLTMCICYVYVVVSKDVYIMEEKLATVSVEKITTDLFITSSKCFLLLIQFSGWRSWSQLS